MFSIFSCLSPLSDVSLEANRRINKFSSLLIRWGHLYLHVSRLRPIFLLVVIQSGERHVFHQLLELLVSGHEVCLTVDLHPRHKQLETGQRGHRMLDAALVSPPPSLQPIPPQTHRSDPLWLCGPPACWLCSSLPSEPVRAASFQPAGGWTALTLKLCLWVKLWSCWCNTWAGSLSNFSRAFLQLMKV